MRKFETAARVGLVLALVACPLIAERPRAELPPPDYIPKSEDEETLVRMLSKARSVEHLKLNKYEIPNEEIPLLYLFDSFFALHGYFLDDPVFLKRLDIEPGTPAHAALANAINEYRANEPTVAERRADQDAFAALVDDPAGWAALGRQRSMARAEATANIVHRLVHDLDEAGASMAGVRLYLETHIRPNKSVASTEPGGDPEWFERGREFCEISRLPDCVRGHNAGGGR